MVFHLWTFQANKNTCWSFAKVSNRLWPRLKNSLSLVAHFGQQWSVVLHHPLQLSPDLLRLAPNTSQCSSDHLELHGTCGKQSLAQKNVVCTKQNLEHPSQLERGVNDCARKIWRNHRLKTLQKQHVKTQKLLGASQISVCCELFCQGRSECIILWWWTSMPNEILNELFDAERNIISSVTWAQLHMDRLFPHMQVCNPIALPMCSSVSVLIYPVSNNCGRGISTVSFTRERVISSHHRRRK